MNLAPLAGWLSLDSDTFINALGLLLDSALKGTLLVAAGPGLTL